MDSTIGRVAALQEERYTAHILHSSSNCELYKELD